MNADGRVATRRRARLAGVIGAIGLAAASPPGAAQTLEPLGTGTEELIPPDIEPLQGRLVRRVRFEGLERVPEQFALNQLRTEIGRPLDWRVVRADVRNLERLGEFRRLEAEVEVLDGLEVGVVYRVVEAPIVRDIEVAGNRELADQELARAVGNVALLTDVPIDDFRIGQAARAIEALYREKGYYQVEVRVDESELADTGVVIFRIREGERLQVTAIRFEGNASFDDRVLRERLRTETEGLLQTAPLDDAVLDEDITELVSFYRDRGHLDVRASRRVLPSPNGREAIVTFVIDEGAVYTLRNVEVIGVSGELTVLSAEQVRGLMTISPGDTFGLDLVRESTDRVRNGLRQMGYVDASVTREVFKDPERNRADLRVFVDEGRRFVTGAVFTSGHDTTKSKVVRRSLDILPEQPLDGTAVETSERRLAGSGIFRGPGPGYPGPSATIQPEDPRYPGYRDVLVEVEETRTGSFGFGASVGSDQGLAGALTLSERNFDIADTPDSLDEFLSGRAFRGAGQGFSLSLSPGTEVSNFAISLNEPSLFESEYSVGGTGFFRNREFTDFDEERFGGRFSLARRLGTRWTGRLNIRAESINIEDIDPDSTVDVFDVEGRSTLTGVGISLNRRTTDSSTRPTRGTVTRLSVEQVGLLGGDYDFTRLGAEHSLFLTIDEDYFGRETVLKLNTSASYIPQEDEAPIFERYFLGGQSFRGFDFRGIGPVGIQADTGLPSDDKVGGDFAFFLGLEVEKPVVDDVIALVGFVDTGTVEDDLSLDNYRVALGFGVRLYVETFSPVPIAFDFGFPVVDEDTDDTRIFSFFVDVPY